MSKKENKDAKKDAKQVGVSFQVFPKEQPAPGQIQGQNFNRKENA